jgi:hypothetical protein
MSDATTLVSTSQPITARLPAKIAVARQIQAFDIEPLQELNERNDRRVGSQQSFEFGGVDDCDRLLAAHRDVLGSLVMGAPDDFTEFRR